MGNKYFTFLYVPSHNSGVKTVRIPKLLVFGLFLALLAVIAFGATAVIQHGMKLSDTYKLSALKKENAILRGQLEGISQEMALLRRQVGQNFDFQKKARLLANMEELNADVAEVGVGGPDFGYIQALLFLDEETRQRVGALSADVDKLIRQARLQTESYEEIMEVLAGTQKRLNSTPSVRPVAHGYVSSGFGRRLDPFTGRVAWHLGIDYSVRQYTAIITTADGVVSFAGKYGAFGKTVEISHGFGFVTRYAHASDIVVRKGQRVKRGDVIARVGSSGRSTAAHLHYEVIQDGKKKDPRAFILTNQEITE